MEDQTQPYIPPARSAVSEVARLMKQLFFVSVVIYLASAMHAVTRSADNTPTLLPAHPPPPQDTLLGTLTRPGSLLQLAHQQQNSLRSLCIRMQSHYKAGVLYIHTENRECTLLPDSHTTYAKTPPSPNPPLASENCHNKLVTAVVVLRKNFIHEPHALISPSS